MEEEQMRYGGVLLSVSSVKASRKFYEDLLGLEVYQDYGRNISFDCGLSLQEDFDWLAKIPKERILREPNNMELFFEEEDLDGFVKKLERYPGILYVHDMAEYPWGQRVIRFYDPDGHILEVGEDMRVVVGRFLGSGMSMEDASKRMGVSVTDLEKILSDRG
ncbi:MAG: VOC family protein [Candidatus Methanoplasma sp.]|jgi:catechol 2,3-dioxygenase-like lactoylglutathione lyase family enzyme|nr:VOC family protein [Candidatus Methanoplasma sp.]